MAKKSRRQTRSASSIESKAASPNNIRSQREEFNPDYTYVINDLHRIGILAGSFLAILIVLTIVLK